MDRFNGQRWHELFSEREKILAYHREPYLAAVVPYITDAIKTQKKPVKILVVGGGRAQGLPPGKKLVGYGGIITLFMKS